MPTTKFQDEIFCPNCGSMQDRIGIDPKVLAEFSGETECICDRCETVFKIEVHVSYTFSTSIK